MPAKSYVSPLDWEKMTPEERQQAELHGFADLDRAMKSGANGTPPARPPAAPLPAYNIIGKEQ